MRALQNGHFLSTYVRLFGTKRLGRSERRVAAGAAAVPPVRKIGRHSDGSKDRHRNRVVGEKPDNPNPFVAPKVPNVLGSDQARGPPQSKPQQQSSSERHNRPQQQQKSQPPQQPPPRYRSPRQSPPPQQTLRQQLPPVPVPAATPVPPHPKPACTRTDELQCPHFTSCSGCRIRGDFADIPAVLRAKQFFSAENVPFDVHLGAHRGHRTFAKLAVQASSTSSLDGLKVGLYREGTHVVDDIPSCVVQHPRINEAAAVIKTLMMSPETHGVIPHRRRDRHGKAAKSASGAEDLRYIQLSYDEEIGKVSAVLVWNADSLAECSPSLSRLVEHMEAKSDLFHSITVNFNTSTNNVIVNSGRKAWVTLFGKAVFPQKVGGATFFFKPQIFRQANMDVFSNKIVPKIVSHVPVGSVVAELYSGIGLIGLNVAHVAKKVMCFDSNSVVEGVFRRGVRTLAAEEDHGKCSYETLDAKDAVLQGRCQQADVLIVDPPRKGLDPAVLDLLLDRMQQEHPQAVAPHVKRLIYVSCGFNSLERDARLLLDSGKWKLVAAEGYVIFPGSDHIETVAVFDRVALDPPTAMSI